MFRTKRRLAINAENGWLNNGHVEGQEMAGYVEGQEMDDYLFTIYYLQFI